MCVCLPFFLWYFRREIWSTSMWPHPPWFSCVKCVVPFQKYLDRVAVQRYGLRVFFFSPQSVCPFYRFQSECWWHHCSYVRLYTCMCLSKISSADSKVFSEDVQCLCASVAHIVTVLIINQWYNIADLKNPLLQEI